MWRPLSGYLLVLLVFVGHGRGNTDWFNCGTQHVCKIFSRAKNWHDAEAVCNGEFGHLASIVSLTEDRDPIARSAAELRITDYWIGLNHLGGLHDQWRFTDGEVVNSDLWQTGYPVTSDNYGLAKMCAVDYRNSIGTVGGFRNEHCDKYNQYVCKKLNDATQPIPPTTPKTPLGEFYCPSDYTAIDPKQEPNMGGKCFKFVFLDDTNGVDWNEAVQRCRDSGRKSDIASVHGPYEHEFIRSQMVNRTFGLWIGLHRTSRGRVWGWLDNSAIIQGDANWLDDEAGAGWEEGCVEVMSIPNAAKWNYVQCDQPRGYICQTYKDPDNPVTEPPPQPQQNCLEGYTPYQYGCYRLLSNTRQSWAEMREECRSHSTDTIESDLVSIHSDAEDATLHIAVMQSGGSAWIGFRETQNNTFEWSNGWYPTYTNWGSIDGEDRDNRGCVAMGNGTNAGWYEADCTTPLMAICKTTDEEPIKAPSTKNGSCPGQLHGVTTWLRHGSYCYLPVTNTMKWQDARLHCAKYGPASTLVSIHSESENQFVHDNMPKSTYSGGAAWIGLYRHKKDQSFHWADKSSLQYEKWNLGEPAFAEEPTFGGGELIVDVDSVDDSGGCVRMYTGEHDSSYWDEYSCNNYSPFMCKVEQGSPVELPPEHPGTCPDGWQKFGAFCYLPFPEILVWWHEAEEQCQREGGDHAHLPTVTNKLQSEFINDIMIEESGFAVPTPYWIGLIQDRGEYVFHWVGTGDEIDPRGFNMFYRGTIRPHMVTGSCVTVIYNTYHENEMWSEQECHHPAGFVCQLPLDIDGLTSGKIAGIVIGVIIALILLSVVILYLLDRQAIINIRHALRDTKKFVGFSNENYENGSTPSVGFTP